MVSIATVVGAVVAATLLLSLLAVWRLHSPDRRWGDVARSRLVMGVPWGSIVVVLGVLSVYLFVQDGISTFDDPVTIPYRSWSYFYPLGMITAPFSHADPSHLTGNLLGTVVAAPIAEYAWSHYPDERGAESFSSWRTNPWVRALVIFPLAVVAVGLATGLFALGPVIGFSGVVFAFVGFAVVHYPIVTIVATLGVQGALVTVVQALQTPIGIYVAQPSPPGPPSWATVAIQGHALGFFVGLVLGILVLRRRDARPDALRVWLATTLFAVSNGLWAIYWFGGEGTYVLFQGPGIAIVALLSIVITAAVAASRRPLLPRRLERRLAGGSPVDRAVELGTGDRVRSEAVRPGRVRELVRRADSEGSSPLSRYTRRGTAFLGVLGVLALLAGVAVPVNLLVLEDPSPGETATVEVEDYTVTYAEDVENELVSGVGFGPLEDEVDLDSSGVIVASEERHVWMEAVTAQELAFTGGETVSVGGPGWREAVHVDRVGWTPIANETVYQVWLQEDGGEPQLAHESDGSVAEVVIGDRTVELTSDDGEFALEVRTTDGEELATAAIPDDGETTEAAGIEFEHDGGVVYGAADGTEAVVATVETYG